MDQESFRKLLETSQSGPSSTRTASRGSLLPSTSKPKGQSETAQPVFKPRKIKKDKDSTYRDRAAERRLGGVNDYAHVEALLEDFERQRADDEDKMAVEEQRRYLGGDGDHSILVKGLDFALLEQNKARAALSTNEDDSLERVFLEASSSAPPAPKKKTREEYIQELKAKKGKVETVNGGATTEGDRPLEDSKNASKFKPVGFKPIAPPVDDKPKRKKAKEKANDGNTKTKKRKIERNDDEAKGNAGDSRKNIVKDSLPPPLPNPPSIPTTVPEPEPINDDFDIFADAGEYEGIDVGDENDSEDEGATSQRPQEEGEPIPKPAQSRGNWFSSEDENPPLHQSESRKDESGAKSNMPPPPEPAPAEEEDQEQLLRLVPLESSALPSIKDFLAMDNAVEVMEKRKKRKEKRKGGKGDGDGEKKLTAEVKADRDYKRLKSYTEKKMGSSSGK